MMTSIIKQRIDQLRHGEVPEGYKKTKVGIVPSDWKETRFKKMFSRLSRKNKENNDNVLTISAQHGLISQRDFFNKDIASEDKSNYFLLHKGEFAYNKSYSNGYPFGALKRLDMYDKGIVSPLYICFSASENNKCPDFYCHYFEAGMMNREIQAFAQEGARNHGLLNISVDDFFNSYLLMPPLAEQKKIAEILSAQDKLIALKEKLIEEKKRQKKYLMQQLLTCKKRLPGFSGEWKKMKIGDICLLNPSLGAQIDENESIVFLGMSDVSEEGNIIIQNIKMYKDVKSGFTSFMRGDILIAKITPCFENGKGAKTEKLLTNYGFGSTEFHVLRCKPLIHNLFMFYHTVTDKFRLKLENEMTGSAGQKRVQISSIAQYYIDVPPIEEQAAIVNPLSTIDNEIELLTSSLDQEKQKKKALMQLLLSGIVRVNV